MPYAATARLSPDLYWSLMKSKQVNTVAYPYDPARCPFTATWNVIGEKWKGIIWWRLSKGVGGFGELRRAIPQITKKMLTQQLREMERDGLVLRQVVSQKPLRVDYELTEYGRGLAPIIEAICRWGGTHLERTQLGKPS